MPLLVLPSKLQEGDEPRVKQLLKLVGVKSATTATALAGGITVIVVVVAGEVPQVFVNVLVTNVVPTLLPVNCAGIEEEEKLATVISADVQVLLVTATDGSVGDDNVMLLPTSTVLTPTIGVAGGAVFIVTKSVTLSEPQLFETTKVTL